MAEGLEDSARRYGAESPQHKRVKDTVETVLALFGSEPARSFGPVRLRLVQEKLVKGGRFSEDVLYEVLATLRKYLGGDMRIDVVFVDNVELVATGKRLASVSRLGVDFQRAAPAVIRTGGD